EDGIRDGHVTGVQTWLFRSQFPNPREQLVYPGFHLAVDPSSRYMALACAQDFFVVSELQSHEMLNERYQAGESLQPVTKFHAREIGRASCRERVERTSGRRS